jgi:hypothetical protein
VSELYVATGVPVPPITIGVADADTALSAVTLVARVVDAAFAALLSSTASVDGTGVNRTLTIAASTPADGIIVVDIVASDGLASTQQRLLVHFVTSYSESDGCVGSRPAAHVPLSDPMALNTLAITWSGEHQQAVDTLLRDLIAPAVGATGGQLVSVELSSDRPANIPTDLDRFHHIIVIDVDHRAAPRALRASIAASVVAWRAFYAS